MKLNPFTRGTNMYLNILNQRITSQPNQITSLIQGPQIIESKKVWVGKIPEGVSDTFMKRLLESCGNVTSWKRMSDSTGKLNSFGICEYLTVESLLKSLRLLNNYPLLNSELQIKIGSETEEYLKKWREQKKLEWVTSLKLRGINIDLNDIKLKEERGEPLEWELNLISRDQETLKIINDVVNQREQIELFAKQNEKPEIYLKDLKELNGTLNFESQREKDRAKKKLDKIKKMEKLFIEEEKKWLKYEDMKLREKSHLRHEKERMKRRKQKLLERDLNFDIEIEKQKRLENPKKYEEHEQERLKEKEFDDMMRKKENSILFNDIKKNNEITSIITLPKEPEAKTKIEIQEYKPDEELNENKKPSQVIELNIKNNVQNGLVVKGSNKKEESDSDDDDLYKDHDLIDNFI